MRKRDQKTYFKQLQTEMVKKVREQSCRPPHLIEEVSLRNLKLVLQRAVSLKLKQDENSCLRRAQDEVLDFMLLKMQEHQAEMEAVVEEPELTVAQTKKLFNLPQKSAEKVKMLADLIRKEWAEEERLAKEEGAIEDDDFDMMKIVHQSRDQAIMAKIYHRLEE